jgi:hypothetical protein
MDGASPESVQVTVKAVPPGTLAPAAGAVNSGYAKAAGKIAARKTRAFDERMAIVWKTSDLRCYFKWRSDLWWGVRGMVKLEIR